MQVPLPQACGAAPRPETVVAFDFGTRRIGVAVGNTLLREGQALRTIAAEGEARWAPIAAVLHEWQPQVLVVGVPCHPDGAAHAMTRAARNFARQLHLRSGLPVHEVDERYTSVEAGMRLARGERVDAVAAAVILEQFLGAPDALADAPAKFSAGDPG